MTLECEEVVREKMEGWDTVYDDEVSRVMMDPSPIEKEGKQAEESAPLAASRCGSRAELTSRQNCFMTLAYR